MQFKLQPHHHCTLTMSFGFSVGDFIGGIELIGTVIASLRDSGGASSEYRELIQELLALEHALIQVKRLDESSSLQHQAQYLALTQAACHCQHTIDAFWTKARRYQPHLVLSDGVGSVSARTKSAWMKIRWSLCRSEDLAVFKLNIMAHTQAIMILLATLQMVTCNSAPPIIVDRRLIRTSQAELKALETKQTVQQNALNQKIRDAAQLSMEKLTGIASNLSQ